MRAGAFLAVSSDVWKKRKSTRRKNGFIVVKLCWGVFLSCLYPLVASGDTGEKPLFHAQTLASESKALHGWHITASDSSDGTDRGSLWVSIQPHTKDNTGEMGAGGEEEDDEEVEGICCDSQPEPSVSGSILEDFFSCFFGIFLQKKQMCIPQVTWVNCDWHAVYPHVQLPKELNHFCAHKHKKRVFHCSYFINIHEQR